MVAPSGRGRCGVAVSLIAALTGAVPSCGHAQDAGSVSGTVTDPAGEPLPGVVVGVPRLGISVASNASGRYLLARVLAGHRVLQFRRIGFAPHQAAVDVAVDTTLTVDAVLHRQPVQLDSILVEGVSRAPDRMIDAPAAVDVVRPATAEPLSLTGEVPLALARVPGLDVTQEGVTDFDVNARGFNTTLSRKLLVLQDGRDLATGIGGSQIWGVLSEPLEDLGRIEVIRGPGSASYGANAYNGVISITTPPARDIIGTKLTVGGGELGTMRTDLRQAGVLFGDRFGYRANAGYTRSDDWTQSRTSKDSLDWAREYEPATPTPPPPAKPERVPLIGQTKDPVTGRALGTPDPVVSVYGSARVDFYAANGSVFTLEGGTARLDNSVFLGANARNQVPRVVRPWARLAWGTDGSGISAWYSGTSSSFVGLASGTTAFLDESLFHLDGRTSRTVHGGAGRVLVGASVQQNKVNSQGTALSPPYDDRSDQYVGAFAQLEYGFGRLRVIGAVRWDDSDLFPTQLSPKGALVLSPAKDQALHLSVERAFLTPILAHLFFGSGPAGAGLQDLSAIEAQLRSSPSLGHALDGVPSGKLFDNSAAVPESSFGNPHLVPQTVTSYEVGYKSQVGRHVFVTLDAYDAHLRNFLTDLLPAGTTGLNPAYHLWTPPPQVPAASRAAVDSAVQSALMAAANPVAANGLTRLANGTTAIVLSFGNAGTVDEWGIELGGNASLGDALSVSASYAWSKFAIRQNLAGNLLKPNAPQNKGTVALTYLGHHRLDLGVAARIVSRYHWTVGVWDGDIPASQVVDVNTGYRVNPHLRVFANCSDLFDRRRFEVYGGAVIGRRVLAGVTSTF